MMVQSAIATIAGSGAASGKLSFNQSVMFPKKSDTASSAFPKKSLIIVGPFRRLPPVVW